MWVRDWPLLLFSSPTVLFRDGTRTSAASLVLVPWLGDGPGLFRFAGLVLAGDGPRLCRFAGEVLAGEEYPDLETREEYPDLETREEYRIWNPVRNTRNWETVGIPGCGKPG